MTSDNLAVIFCYAKFDWKILFTKPLRYIIQLFTGKYCHCAIYLNDYISDATGKGVKKAINYEWFSNYQDNNKNIKIEIFYLLKPLSPDQIESVNTFINKNIGIKYSVLEAVISPIDNKYFHYNDPKKTFCTEFARDCLVNARILAAKKHNIKTDLNEFYRELKKKKLIERNGIIYV
jgi:hypothetical protein